MIVYSQLPLKVLLSSMHLALSDLIPLFSLDFMLNSPKNSSKSFQQHQTWWLLIFLREEIRRQKNKLKKTSKSLKMSLIIESQNCIEIFRWQVSPEVFSPTSCSQLGSFYLVNSSLLQPMGAASCSSPVHH